MNTVAQLLGLTPEEFSARCAEVPFQLRDYQQAWGMRALEILLTNRCYMDTSAPRAGKSYVALWIASFFQVKVVIVAPPSAHGDWEKAVKLAGVECAGYFSYQSLRGDRINGLKHLYLTRTDTEKETVFQTTSKWRSLVESGVLLILDEMQNLKNKSDQNQAAAAMIRSILDFDAATCPSRFAVLSGTPFEEDRAANILQMMGFIDQNRLYRINPHTKEVNLEGLADLLHYCEEMDPVATDIIRQKIMTAEMSGDVAKGFVTDLFVDVIKKQIVGAMVAPADKSSPLVISNTFFRAGKQARALLRGMFDQLKTDLQYDEEEKTVKITKGTSGLITKARVKIDFYKIPAIFHALQKSLNTDAKMKIVVALNFTSTFNGLIAMLKAYGYDYRCINGSVTKANRAKAVREFNEDPRVRIMLINSKVAVGISLYVPEVVNQPRTMFLLPNYSAIDITQCAARIHGPGMFSSASVKVFYCQGEDAQNEEGELSHAIMDALTRKSRGIKRIIHESVQETTILPCDYLTEMEQAGDDNPDLVEEGFDWSCIDYEPEDNE